MSRNRRELKDSAYKFFEFQMKPLLTTKVSQHCPSGLKSNDFRADKAGRPRGAGRSRMRWECRCCAPHPSTRCTGRGGCSTLWKFRRISRADSECCSKRTQETQPQMQVLTGVQCYRALITPCHYPVSSVPHLHMQNSLHVHV